MTSRTEARNNGKTNNDHLRQVRKESSRRSIYGDLDSNRERRKDRQATVRLAVYEMLVKNRSDWRRGMKRRDITLGEMQDECYKRLSVCAPAVEGSNGCMYFEVCKQMRTGVFLKKCPEDWDLSDPPRFTEAQMAFWRGWYAIGAKFVKRRFGTGCVDFSLTTKDFCTSYPSVLPNDIAIQLEEGKAYDLAELLGKDAP